MFEPLQKFIPQAARTYGVVTELRAAEICQQFRKLVPDIFANKPDPQVHIQPAHYKDKTLTINVTSPAWAQEVIMRKGKIIDEINTQAGREVISNLRTQLKQSDQI